MRNVMVVLVAALAIAASANANMLTNGDFSDGLTGWTAWSVPNYGASPGTMNPQLNGDAFVGNPRYLDGDYASSQIGYQSAHGGAFQTIEVDNGVYTISGWLAGGESAGGWRELKAWDGEFPGGEGDGGVVVISNTTNWTLGSTELTVTTGKLTVGWKVGQYWGGIVAGHVDSISVTPEPAAMLLLGLPLLLVRRRRA